MLRAFGPLFGEQHGDGPPAVVALPGWMRTRHDFAAVLDGLPAVALDLPGMGGATPPPSSVIGSDGYAELVAEALRASPPVVVVGHSFGGRVAVQLAAHHPEVVRALVVTGTPFKFADDLAAARPPVSYRLVRWLHRRHLISDRRMEALRQARGSADYNAAQGVMRDILVRVVNEDYSNALARIGAPIELVYGTADTAAPLAGAQRAATLVAGPCALTPLDGIGHLVPTQAPAALRAAIDRQLTS